MESSINKSDPVALLADLTKTVTKLLACQARCDSLEHRCAEERTRRHFAAGIGNFRQRMQPARQQLRSLLAQAEAAEDRLLDFMERIALQAQPFDWVKYPSALLQIDLTGTEVLLLTSPCAFEPETLVIAGSALPLRAGWRLVGGLLLHECAPCGHDIPKRWRFAALERLRESAQEAMLSQRRVSLCVAVPLLEALAYRCDQLDVWRQRHVLSERAAAKSRRHASFEVLRCSMEKARAPFAAQGITELGPAHMEKRVAWNEYRHAETVAAFFKRKQQVDPPKQRYRSEPLVSQSRIQHDSVQVREVEEHLGSVLPKLLFVQVEPCRQAVTGVYALLREQRANGFPIWEQYGGGLKLFSSTTGYWMIAADTSNEVAMRSSAAHGGRLPPSITGWERFIDGSWRFEGAAKVLEVPRSVRIAGAAPPAFSALRVTVPQHPQLSGVFELLHGCGLHGMPIWKQVAGDQFLYSTANGCFTISNDMTENTGFVSSQPHEGRDPHLVARWFCSWQDVLIDDVQVQIEAQAEVASVGPPLVLTVVSPNCEQRHNGDYYLVPNNVRNQCPQWRNGHTGACVFSTGSGHWMIGQDTGEFGHICSAEKHNGRWPTTMSHWECFMNNDWCSDRTITVTANDSSAQTIAILANLLQDLANKQEDG